MALIAVIRLSTERKTDEERKTPAEKISSKKEEEEEERDPDAQNREEERPEKPWRDRENVPSLCFASRIRCFISSDNWVDGGGGGGGGDL
jgi:hypothetical protein